MKWKNKSLIVENKEETISNSAVEKITHYIKELFVSEPNGIQLLQTISLRKKSDIIQCYAGGNTVAIVQKKDSFIPNVQSYEPTLLVDTELFCSQEGEENDDDLEIKVFKGDCFSELGQIVSADVFYDEQEEKS